MTLPILQRPNEHRTPVVATAAQERRAGAVLVTAARIFLVLAAGMPACEPRSGEPKTRPGATAYPSVSSVAPRASTRDTSNQNSQKGAKHTTPRPVSPASGTTIATHSVRLRWQPRIGTVYVLLSRSLDFSTLERRESGSDGELVVSELQPGRWFWRLMEPDSGDLSAVFAFRVLRRETNAIANQGVWHGNDINADGYDDVLLPGGVLLGREHWGQGGLHALPFAFGSEVPAALAREPAELPHDWGTPVSFGDIDGDGVPNVAVRVARRSLSADFREPVRFWLEPATSLRIRWRTANIAPMLADPIGDVNGDGYFDWLECPRYPSTDPCTVRAGAPDIEQVATIGHLRHYAVFAAGADLNNDGPMDFVGITEAGDLAIHYGTSTGMRDKPDQLVKLDVGSTVRTVTLLDMDADANAEVLGLGCLDAKYERPCWWVVTTSKGPDGSTHFACNRSDSPAELGRCLLPCPYMRWSASPSPATKGGAQIAAVIEANQLDFASLLVEASGRVLVRGVTAAGRDPDIYSKHLLFVGDVDGNNSDDLLVKGQLVIGGNNKHRLFLGTSDPISTSNASYELESNEVGHAGVVQ